MASPLLIVPARPPLATVARSTPPSSPTVVRKQMTLPNFAAAPNLTMSPPPPASPKTSKVPGSKSPRRRALGPGCSLLDWIRLSRSGKDLAGTGGEKRVVTEAELAKHNTIDDAWTAIRGMLQCLHAYSFFFLFYTARHQRGEFCSAMHFRGVIYCKVIRAGAGLFVLLNWTKASCRVA